MPIITISREMGTGAFKIAQEVSRKLKFKLIDGAKLLDMAEEYGLSRQIIERIDERPPSYNTSEDRLKASHLKILEIMILEAAKKGNVIIYGRGGQDLLAGIKNLLRIRFIAPFEERVEVIAEREWIDPDIARDLIRKNDHQRGGFIYFYFDRNWNDPLGYDLTFNTLNMSQSSIIDSIVIAAKDPKLKDRDQGVSIIENRILCLKVEAALLKSKKIGNLALKVSANDGSVTLAGHVYSEDDRVNALKESSKVKGVVELVDELQVLNYKPYSEPLF